MSVRASEKSSVDSNKHSTKSATTSPQYKPNTIDVYFLVMTITLGGQYNRWNDAYLVGFGGAMVSMTLNAIGYMCFAACMAEMAGTLPFSGGVYGFVRAFLGPLMGYIVSRYEIMLVITYVRALGMSIAKFPTLAGVSPKEYEPAWWLLLYGSAVGIATVGCNYAEYWAFIRLIGTCSLVLLIIYCLGAISAGDFSANAEPDVYDFTTNFVGYMNTCAGMYRGIHFLPLLSVKVGDPKVHIPQGAFISMVSLCLTAFAMVFAVASYAPGPSGVANSSLPMVPGFMKIFNLTAEQAMWLNFPALFGNFYGFVWAYGRQLSAMAKSGLLPEFFGWMTPVNDTPYMALILGSIVCLGFSWLCFYNPLYENFVTDMTNMYPLTSYMIYAFLFVTYAIFKLKYSSLARTYTSPFGLAGAFVGFSVFMLDLTALIHFNRDVSLNAIYFILVSTVLIIIYYFLVLHGNQQFSEEEKEKLFKAYLISANQKSRAAVKKRGSPAKGSTTAAARSGHRRNNSTASGVMSQSSENSGFDFTTSGGESSSRMKVLNVSSSTRVADSGVVPLNSSPGRAARKHNQVIPEGSADEESCCSTKKENALVAVETVQDANAVMMGKEDEGEEADDEAEVPVSSSLLASLSEKYNLSKKLAQLAGSVAPEQPVQAVPVVERDMELGHSIVPQSVSK